MNFDLNINNYSQSELAEILKLPLEYDESIIHIKHIQLKESIIKNKEINKETQQNIIYFIDNAKNIILQNKNKQQHNVDIYHTNTNMQKIPVQNVTNHMIQKEQTQPYVASFNSDIYTGIVNPLKRRTQFKQLNVDTKFRENYSSTSSSNCNFIMPNRMENIVNMQLTSIELPNSYCVISNVYGNNYFAITIAKQTTVISIPTGNYDDNNTVINLINQQIQAADIIFHDIIFSLDLSNNHTIINNNTTENFEINFQTDKYGTDDTNTPIQLKLGWILGFRNNKYVNNFAHTSESLMDTSGPKYLFLCLNDYNNSVVVNTYTAYKSIILSRNILARITTSVSGQNNLNIITTPREYFGPVTINAFNVQLLDDYGRIVDLDSMDFSFYLTLTTAYDI